MKKLIEKLQKIAEKDVEPNMLRNILNSFDSKSFRLDRGYLELETDKYLRRMILDEPVQVFLMSWPPQFFFPIHQHNNFWGYVLPLDGVLSETIYGYAPNKRKVFIHPTKNYKEGEIIYEPLNVIHKLQNASPIHTLHTLHIYAPPHYNFNGTMIFDAKNRRLAELNDKAEELSWQLDKDQYNLVAEDAYDLEKLF